MGGRKQRKKNLDKVINEANAFSNQSAPARNMRKADLGAVILGCTHSTIKECFSSQLFGLPAWHFSYIKNITQGLVLFLFNYSDRKLHGIFEAASPGQMNIDKYAWVADRDGTEYTTYPAQVRIRVRQPCQPLSEDQFRPIIANNYYEEKLFYFELDHDQTNKLVLLFTSSPVNGSASFSQNETRRNNLFRFLPVSVERHARHADNAMPNLKAEAGDQANEKGSSWDAVGVEVFAENPNQTSRLSSASVVGSINNPTTKATSTLPTGKWSALFESQPTFEAPNEDEKCKVQASNVSSSASDISNSLPQSWDTWEESQLIATTMDETECVQTWVDSSHQHSDKPSSSSQPDRQIQSSGVSFPDAGNDIHNCSSEVSLHDNPYCKLSSSLKPNENDVEENHEKDRSLVPHKVTVMSTNLESSVIKLMQEVEVLKGSQLKHILKTNLLEQELVESKLEIQQLRNRLDVLESGSRTILAPAKVDDQLPSKCRSKLVDSVFIVGGYDGSSWLLTLDSYFPSHDTKRSLNCMNFVKKYASAATLNGEIYHFGGMGSHTVESFSLTNNQWVSRPPLFWKNVHFAGASLNDKLFAVGGGNGLQCSSEVEYLDLNIGRWLPTRSMQSKRLAPAATGLNNALYVAGGYNGISYLSSVEMFDPREQAWYELPSMNTRKGCHSLVVLNEKLYALGGFDGDKYVSTVEFLDPRFGSWVEAEPMNVSRGNFGAFVLGEELYGIGGSKENDEVLDIVERYKEGSSWEVADLKAIGKRSHFSAIVL